MPVCCIKGCARKYYAKGFCQTHYVRVRKYGDPNGGPTTHAPADVRFWRSVEKGGPSECWPYVRGKGRGPYGLFQAGGKGSPNIGAHRFSYQMHFGEIPDGKWVLHRCDVPRCVNPNHLFVGAAKDNTHDMIEKGRKRTVAPRGTENGKAKLTPETVRIIRQSKLRRDILATHLGVSVSAIRDVRSGRSWSHIS